MGLFIIFVPWENRSIHVVLLRTVCNGCREYMSSLDSRAPGALLLHQLHSNSCVFAIVEYLSFSWFSLTCMAQRARRDEVRNWLICDWIVASFTIYVDSIDRFIGSILVADVSSNSFCKLLHYSCNCIRVVDSLLHDFLL